MKTNKTFADFQLKSDALYQILAVLTKILCNALDFNLKSIFYNFLYFYGKIN